MGAKIDLTNKKFNYLYVLGEVPKEERKNPKKVELIMILLFILL